MEPTSSMKSTKRLTDAQLRALQKTERTEEHLLPDGTVSGLAIRLFPGGAANWTLRLRVAGEGGVNEHGKRLLGRKIRLNLGNYPTVTIESARAQANYLIGEAKRGVNPKDALKAAATAGTLTVEDLSREFMQEHIYSRELDSAANYENAFKVHIIPQVGERLAELLAREDVRAVMEKARTKRPRPNGQRGGPIGGVEAARTAMGVLRHMYSWALEEGKLKRKDNPVSKLTKNLPKQKQGDVVLTLAESRIVWQAARLTGYPFGTHVQLMLLTGCRLDEWASACAGWIDYEESLIVIPADEYKTGHVHVVPLVPQALAILKSIPQPRTGDYLLSSDRGRTPIRGVSKFYRTRLADAIVSVTGSKLSKDFTSHDLRRTVATRIAEVLGENGDKLVKRVLGHSDGSVTSIYNRYAYVREMRQVLEIWANDLTAGLDVVAEQSGASSKQAAPRSLHVMPTSVVPAAAMR